MELTINTTKRGNISRLTRDRLKEMDDMLDGDATLDKNTLVLLGTELAAHNLGRMDQVNLERLLEMMNDDLADNVLKQIQNTFSEYVMRALEGKQDGGATKGKRRKTSKKSHRKTRRTQKRTYKRRL